MRLFQRTIVLIMAVIFMFCSLVLALYSFGMAEVDFLPELFKNIYQRWDIGILLLLGFVLGALTIYPIFGIDSNSRSTKITESDLGRINITLAALDNIIKEVALGQDGVEEISTSLDNGEDGLEISLTGKVSPGVIIPDLTDQLQKIIKSYLEDTTGVTVSQVEVLIDEISKKNQMIEDQ